MPGYTYQFVDTVPLRCVCPVCRLPMRRPATLGRCGHSLCSSCIGQATHLQLPLRHDRSVGGHDEKMSAMCPLDELIVDRNDVRKNSELQEIIEDCMIRCPHEPRGCLWVDTVRNVLMHLESCRHVPDTGPSDDCGTRVARGRTREQQQQQQQQQEPRANSSQQQQQPRCQPCRYSLAAEDLQHHACPVDSHRNSEAPDGSSGYCSPDATTERWPARLSRRQHQVEAIRPSSGHAAALAEPPTRAEGPPLIPKRAVSAERRLESASVRRQASFLVPEATPRSSAMDCPLRSCGCRFKGSDRPALERHAKEAAASHVTLLAAQVRSQARELAGLKRRLLRQPVSYDGLLVWRLDNYSRRLLQPAGASAGSEENCSGTFYTGRPGYLLQASVFLNGNGTDNAGYLSLYAKLLPGEFDPLLDWPYARPIRMRLLDQSGGQRHLVRGFRPEPGWRHFGRPAAEAGEALGFGFPRFASHQTVAEGGYVRDDAIFLEIAVL